MSRLEIPITGKVLPSTGDLRLWADVDLLLKDGAGNLQRHPFRVDTATDVTTMLAYEAKQLGLPMPQNPARLPVHRPTGLALRSGILRFRIGGMDQTEYVTPCLFLGDPDTPPAGLAGKLSKSLSQPFALLDWLRFTMDKDPSAGLLYGVLVVEKR